MLYDFKCGVDGEVREVRVHLSDLDTHVELCTQCGRPMRRLFAKWLGSIQWQGRFYGTGRSDALGPLGEGTGGGRR